MAFRERQRRELAQSLVDLLAAGHEPEEALRLLGEVAPAYRPRLRGLRATLKEGGPLDGAGILPQEVVAMIEAGRASGKLAEVMQRAARLVRASHLALRSSLWSLIYPLGLMYILGFYSIIFHKGAQVMVAQRPQTSIGAVTFFGSWSYLGALLGATALLLYWAWWRSRLLAKPNVVTIFLERTVGALPGVRGVLHRLELARAASALAATMEAAVPLPRCLELAAGACRGSGLAAALRRAGYRVGEGATLEQALGQERIPRPLQVATRNAADEDLPLALWSAADAALVEARISSRRLGTGVFCLALLVAAFCIGLTLTQLWIALSRVPEVVT